MIHTDRPYRQTYLARQTDRRDQTDRYCQTDEVWKIGCMHASRQTLITHLGGLKASGADIALPKDTLIA